MRLRDEARKSFASVESPGFVVVFTRYFSVMPAVFFAPSKHSMSALVKASGINEFRIKDRVISGDTGTDHNLKMLVEICLRELF